MIHAILGVIVGLLGVWLVGRVRARSSARSRLDAERRGRRRRRRATGRRQRRGRPSRRPRRHRATSRPRQSAPPRLDDAPDRRGSGAHGRDGGARRRR